MPDQAQEARSAAQGRDDCATAKFAVRIERGLVTHYRDHPLTTWEEANECRQAILKSTGEDGEIEEVLLSVKA